MGVMRDWPREVGHFCFTLFKKALQKYWLPLICSSTRDNQTLQIRLESITANPVPIMSNISKRIAEFIKARPSMQNTLRPLASSYIGLAGHRRIGLKYSPDQHN